MQVTQIVLLDIFHSAIFNSIWCLFKAGQEDKKDEPSTPYPVPTSSRLGNHLDMCLLLLQHMRHISNKRLMVLMAGGSGLKRRSQLLGFGLGLIDLVLKSRCLFFTLLENMANQVQVQIR